MSYARVVELQAADTHALRRSVLRVGVPATDVEFAEDTWLGAQHLGMRWGDELVAVSTWIPRAAPDDLPIEASTHTVQLRGMATSSNLQGTGLGGALLEEGCRRMASNGCTLVWARARDAALAFYQRHGFEVVGDGFVDANTQLPHHFVVRRIG